MLKRILAMGLLSLSITITSGADAAETMKIGITTTGIPFSFVEASSNTTKGAMVDLAKAVAEDNGMEATFEIAAFAALIPSLNTGKIDAASTGMFITDERKKIVNFSDPVYSYGEGMFVAATDKDTNSREALKGQAVGAQIGTAFVEPLKSLGIFGEVKVYDSIADIMRDVKLGRIKAGFGDGPIAVYQVQHNPDLGVRMVDNYTPVVSNSIGLAVNKQNTALLDKINASIRKFKASGELTKIFAKYGL